MALSLSSGGGEQFMPGVWINDVTVKYMDTSEYNKDFNGNPYDFAIELTVEKNGYDKKMWFRGNLSKKKADSWGSALRVRDLFVALGLFDDLTKEELAEKLAILEQKDIPADFFIKAKGKKLITLEYVNDLYQGKPSYKSWDVVKRPDYDKKKFLEEFKKEIERKKKDGYPLPYKPELMELKPSESTKSDGDTFDNFDM